MLKLHQALRLLAILLFIWETSPAIASTPKWIKVITDEDQIANYVDFSSIQAIGSQRSYMTRRVFPRQASNDSEMAFRRPYHGERCPCPYDFASNESHCGGRASGKTTCFAPTNARQIVLLNSLDCRTKVRGIIHIYAYSSSGEKLAEYSSTDITGGAYPESVTVTDPFELATIKAVCSR